MAVEVLYRIDADQREIVKRLQERLAWLEAVHELQSIRLSRLETEAPEEALNEEALGPARGERCPQY
jgi:hypothetical protein